MIAIGNIAIGGRAKTPLAELFARRLRAMGERPSILSRGYARRDAADGVVVVRDLDGIRADLDRAGDEPLMLARRLDGVPVLVSASRYLAGRLAEHHFGCTVHLLDDGFQHFDLHRDANVVAISRADVERGRTLPWGYLREPLEAAHAADAYVALDGAELGPLAGAKAIWRASFVQSPRTTDEPVLALAGIGSPDRFFDGLSANGWSLVSTVRFADHCHYRTRQLDVIRSLAVGARARRIVTTEKDFVRLLPSRPLPFPMPVEVVTVALELEGPPLDAWLAETVARARA